MCGITGFVTASPTPQQAPIDLMTGVIEHRGPDETGRYVDSWAALGHRRLSIIDLAAGQQPMCNETRDLWIVYNGEIFNHAALRPALIEAGHRYQTRCDTETILHAYEEYGTECLSLFRGMFAFAIWDKNRRQLFCARDRMGIKPFYYYFDGRLFAFASEIKALLKHPSISAKLDESVLSEHLAFGYTSSDKCLFRGIQKLMPGHFLRVSVDADGLSLVQQRYWEVPEPPERSEVGDEASWIRECRERLEETVNMRLMSDVPLGMFLSGGVDSSAIAALMKRMVSGPVETFSVGYEESAFSELGYAREVAESIGTHHHEVVLSMDDFFNVLPRLIWHEDEPIAWPSSVSLYFVSRLAAQRVKVVLTGEGSDELFGGYSRYPFYRLNERWSRAYGVLPSAVSDSVRRFVANSSLLSASLRRKLQHTFVGRKGDLESLYLDNFYCAFSQSEQRHILAGDGVNHPYENFLQYWESRAHNGLLPRMLFTDQKTYLVELLMKQDQMSMACSIESRVPFLDHPFVEFAARVPDEMKIHGGCTKYILKRAVEDLLPRSIIYRKKMGFPTPLRQWLLSEKAQPLLALLESRDGLLAEHLNGAAVRRLLERHVKGEEDATDRIWRLLNLQLWGDIFLTGRRDATDGLLASAAGTYAH